MKTLSLLVATAAAASVVSGQERTAPDVTAAQEIAIARSAAPSHVSADATVLVLQNDEYVEAVAGTNDVTCMVSRSFDRSFEPICYDAEASRSILELEKLRVKLRINGASEEEIVAAQEAAIGAGEIPLPRRPALAYMMSSEQVLYTDEGDRYVGEWMPHLMLYMPYMTEDELGLYGPPSVEAAMVFNDGQPTATLVIPVRNFVTPTE